MSSPVGDDATSYFSFLLHRFVAAAQESGRSKPTSEKRPWRFVQAAARLNPQPPTLNSLDAPRDYFFFGSWVTASPTHSHFPLRSIHVSTQPNERLNCFPSLSLPLSEEMPTTVARFGP